MIGFDPHCQHLFFCSACVSPRLYAGLFLCSEGVDGMAGGFVWPLPLLSGVGGFYFSGLLARLFLSFSSEDKIKINLYVRPWIIHTDWTPSLKLTKVADCKFVDTLIYPSVYPSQTKNQLFIFIFKWKFRFIEIFELPGLLAPGEHPVPRCAQQTDLSGF